MDKVLKLAMGIKLPLSLAALGLLIFYLIINSVLGMGIFANLSEGSTFEILNSILSFVFWIALAALIVGAILYIIPYIFPKYKKSNVEIVSSNLNVNLSESEPSDLTVNGDNK